MRLSVADDDWAAKVRLVAFLTLNEEPSPVPLKVRVPALTWNTGLVLVEIT